MKYNKTINRGCTGMSNEEGSGGKESIIYIYNFLGLYAKFLHDKQNKGRRDVKSETLFFFSLIFLSKHDLIYRKLSQPLSRDTHSHTLLLS